MQEVVLCRRLFHGYFLPAPRPICVFKDVLRDGLLSMCRCSFAVYTIRCVRPARPPSLRAHSLPRKRLYPVLFSCFSHPARAAATSLLAPLPKHSLALTSRTPTTPLCSLQHTHMQTVLLHLGTLHRLPFISWTLALTVIIATTATPTLTRFALWRLWLDPHKEGERKDLCLRSTSYKSTHTGVVQTVLNSELKYMYF